MALALTFKYPRQIKISLSSAKFTVGRLKRAHLEVNFILTLNFNPQLKSNLLPKCALVTHLIGNFPFDLSIIISIFQFLCEIHPFQGYVLPMLAEGVSFLFNTIACQF